MRTTVTIDDDVAVRLQRLRASEGKPFKQLVNEVLRAGLAQLDQAPERPRGPFTRPVSLGKPLLPDLDDVSDALALAEGDDYR